MARMIWDKLLSTKRISDLGPCATEVQSESQLLDPRTPFEKDCDDIIYSYPFRRLQDKTQVIPFPEFDFVHTRLTHSLEVAAVGRTLGKLAFELIQKESVTYLQKENITAGDVGSLVAAACFAHDIGNPPFGHSGEAAISHYFIETGEFYPGFIITDVKNGFATIQFEEEGEKKEIKIPEADAYSQLKMHSDLITYEGNANGFRIITRNCEKGINPTIALMGTFTKYPRESLLVNFPESFKSNKSFRKFGYFQSERAMFKQIAEELQLINFSENPNDLIYSRHPLAYLMEAADDIVYGIIDFEDGCRLNLIDFDRAYTVLKLKDKETNKDEEKTINDSPKNILIKIASRDSSFSQEKLSSFPSTRDSISYLRSKVINVLTHECFKVFHSKYEEIMLGKYPNSLLMDINPDIFNEWKKMKWLVQKYVYNYPPVLYVEASGFEVVENLIDSLGITTGICYSCNEIPDAKQKKLISLLPDEYLLPDNDGSLSYSERYQRMMNILDYIAGMTDNFAISLFRKIKGVALVHR